MLGFTKSVWYTFKRRIKSFHTTIKVAPRKPEVSFVMTEEYHELYKKLIERIGEDIYKYQQSEHYKAGLSPFSKMIIEIEEEIE